MSDHYPPGVTDADIDSAYSDPKWDRALDQVPAECPKCLQNVFPAADENSNDHGLGSHIEVVLAEHCVSITCNGPVMKGDEPEECETLLYSADCRCPECEPREREKGD